MITKKVSQLKIGDRIVTKEGNKITIATINNGMYLNSKLLFFKNGQWANVLNSEMVEIES